MHAIRMGILRQRIRERARTNGAGTRVRKEGTRKIEFTGKNVVEKKKKKIKKYRETNY